MEFIVGFITFIVWLIPTCIAAAITDAKVKEKKYTLKHQLKIGFILGIFITGFGAVLLILYNKYFEYLMMTYFWIMVVVLAFVGLFGYSRK